jgi:cyclohexa-1,5-dienecarbonyl-CoA hydratase
MSAVIAPSAAVSARQPLVQIERSHGGAVLRLILQNPPGNLLDRATIRDLRQALLRAAGSDVEGEALRLILFEGRGDNFCFGASVEEHLPGQVEELLPAFHDLLRQVVACHLPTMALIKGKCLGGGLELALCCDLIIAEEGAQLGQPEVVLGVFAPAASALLPARIGQAAAANLLLTGRVIGAQEAHDLGLVAAAVRRGELQGDLDAWVGRFIKRRSAVALSFAADAVRHPLRTALTDVLPGLERAYLFDLMVASDPEEGLRAFLEKRPAIWKHS